MNTARENILWNDFKEGRSNSFRPLFDYFYQSLCEYAFQILENNMDAEDVVLDLFIFIWKNADRINIGKSLSALARDVLGWSADVWDFSNDLPVLK